jgi:hypothetical protein
VYRFFMIGDVGAPSLDVQEPTLKLYQNFLEESSENSAAVFLGDNIYMEGLPDSTHPNRTFYEARINEQLNTLKNFKGRVVFIPGNHDWDDGGEEGLQAVRRQERYIENYLDRGNIFLPDKGFPGPIEIKLMDKDDDPRLDRDIRLVALDTQWWLHPHEKPYGDTGEYDVDDPGDVINEMRDIIRDNKNDYMVVAGHHPFVSKDNHGGYFPLKTHLLPPVGGSLYVLYRKLFGYRQDLPHYKYKNMIRSFKDVFDEKEEIIYVSGHAHGIQYNVDAYKNRFFQHYVVSGAGSKTDYIADGRGAEFNYEDKGFVTLQIYADGSMWMEAWAPVGDGSEGKLLFRTQMTDDFGDPLEGIDEEKLPDIDYSDSTVVTSANPEYSKPGALHRFLMGDNNRNLWEIEAEFPVFDVTEVEGGLTPVRSGGRGQSNTLHLDGANGKEYVLRSVDKVAGKVWDEHLKKSFALKIAQDQFSMLDPYAALVVADLADAGGINYVRPKIYYVPDDPRLGRYGDEMAGSLALFEQKPDGDMSDVASVGFADDVVGEYDLNREIDGDIDHRVDQELFAKSRLFDMIIGDWDRHSDQWRWAAVEPEDEQGKIYKPIPRDRDVTLMQLDGFGNFIAKLGPLFQYQNTRESFGNFKGLNYNSLGITRKFTNQLTREQWIALAEELKTSLTDESIDDAVKEYPEPVYKVRGKEIAAILKERRDMIPEMANLYYDLISNVVSVAGSNKRERFEIEVVAPDRLKVQVFKMSGSGKKREQYYKREFTFDETREVRLYGMGDDDEFVITGKPKNKIRIRIIGGPGADVVTDESPESRRKMFIYDTETGNEFETAKGTNLQLSESDFDNLYNFGSDYNWNSTILGFYFNYNHNDGLFLGGGPKFVKYSYGKSPAQEHYVRGNAAPRTQAANLKYDGTFYDFFGDWNFTLDGEILFPGSYRYFFGLGNETDQESFRSIDYYRGLLWQYSFSGGLNMSMNEFLTVSGTSGLLFTDVKDVTGDQNILTDPQAGVNPNIFSDQLYSRSSLGVKMDGVDNHSNPMSGVSMAMEGAAFLGLNEQSETHTNLNSEFRFYISSQTKRQMTFAGRLAGNHLIGEFPFYQANTIGGNTNLRGYDNRRFSGRSSVYSNNELRFELFDFYDYYLGGKVGATAFFDVGRVWTDGENSDVWHKGYGGGLWFNIFDAFLLSAYYGTSTDDNSFLVKAGFFF